MRSNRIAAALVAAALVVSVGALATAGADSSGPDDSPVVAEGTDPGSGPADAQPTAADGVETAAVERRDLISTQELDGRLTHADERTVTAQEGTVTWLPPAGAVIDAGGTLLRVDEQPVILLPGDVPAYRDLYPGVVGVDVQQLEQALTDLGYATAEEMTVDGTYTQATASIVRRWQEDLGVTEDGRVDLGAVVFTEAPVRVAEHLVAVGDGGGAPALRLTDTDRTVLMDLDAADRGDVAVGQDVEVELPDGDRIPATVTDVSVVAVLADGADDPTVEVTIQPERPPEAWDEAPVDVHLVTSAALDVLAVPVHALLALAEGGYAVEVTGRDLVAVDTGAFADGWVQITGEVAEGETVVIAS